MNEQEQRAAAAYADVKKLILGKFIRTMEYGFSNARNEKKNRTFVADEKRNEEIKSMFYAMLTIVESEIKDELKKMEI